MSIEIKNVSKKFKNKKIIENISLSTKKNEILGLIGPSGAGKTTLIRLITGSLKPDSGDVFIDNLKVPNNSLFKRIGYMPQGSALYTDLSGIDNLKFFGKLYGLEKKELNEKCQKLLELIGLSEDQKELVSKYSGGMKKRLSLIIALIHDPDYLILDEPTVGIDPLLRKVIWEYFYKLALEGKTIIISTHIMDEAVKCTSCALINHGELLEFDLVENLLKLSNNLEDLFFKENRGTK